MEISKILDELRQEQASLQVAILSMQRLAAGGVRRRGRPPAWLKAASESLPKKRGRPPGSKNTPKTSD